MDFSWFRTVPTATKRPSAISKFDSPAWSTRAGASTLGPLSLDDLVRLANSVLVDPHRGRKVTDVRNCLFHPGCFTPAGCRNQNRQLRQFAPHCLKP